MPASASGWGSRGRIHGLTGASPHERFRLSPTLNRGLKVGLEFVRDIRDGPTHAVSGAAPAASLDRGQ
jgi:hypothetical protein